VETNHPELAETLQTEEIQIETVPLNGQMELSFVDFSLPKIHGENAVMASSLFGS
jgi:hypothetical protein